MRHSLLADVPGGFTALPSSRVKGPNDIPTLLDGYRSDDPSRTPVVLKIFEGGIQGPCTIAEHERYLLRRLAGPFVIKLIHVSHMKPSLSTCSILEKWGQNVCELAAAPSSIGLGKLELQRQVEPAYYIYSTYKLVQTLNIINIYIYIYIYIYI
jgi:hypothetical protein